MIPQQLYHVGQHGDADNSYHPNWSPLGMPSYHDSDGSHSMTVAEIEETIEEGSDVPTIDMESKQGVDLPRSAEYLEAVYDIPVQVSAVLGKTTMQVSQLLKLGRGAVIELDRKFG